MSFVHEFNKNNRKYTKRNDFFWHSKILANRLRFLELEKFVESANPYTTERTLHMIACVTNFYRKYSFVIKVYSMI